MIVDARETITLIGGAALSETRLSQAIALGPRAIAADGGADTALAHGIVPEAVIGDFDSISMIAKTELPPERLHHIPEQDSTDFDKCLSRISAPLIIAVGFSGARMDHQLACFNGLVRRAEQPCLLLGEDDLVFLCPPSLHLDLKAGTRLSLFPMGAVEGVSDGLRWPISGLNFAPDGQIGTSNEATGPVDLVMTSPKMLMILPADCLELAVTALRQETSRWP